MSVPRRGCRSECRTVREGDIRVLRLSWDKQGVEGSLRGTFELELEARVQFLWQERKHEHCRWKGTLCPCAFSEEGFGYDQVLV